MALIKLNAFPKRENRREHRRRCALRLPAQMQRKRKGTDKKDTCLGQVSSI
jgi:hypothetical protein